MFDILWHMMQVVYVHILWYGFEPSYDVWIHQSKHLPMFSDDSNNEDKGSVDKSYDDLDELLEDVFLLIMCNNGIEQTVHHVKLHPIQTRVLINCLLTSRT